MGTSGISYIILNVFRGLNILSILACITASASLLVKTADLTDSIGYYNAFDLGEKCLIIMFAMWLLITELPVPFLETYKARNWPLFYYESGFVPLAICLLFIGFDVLSFLAKKDTNTETLGNDFYRMAQAAGFMAIIMAVVNFVASYVLQNKNKGLTARQVRAFKKQASPYNDAV